MVTEKSVDQMTICLLAAGYAGHRLSQLSFATDGEKINFLHRELIEAQEKIKKHFTQNEPTVAKPVQVAGPFLPLPW